MKGLIFLYIHPSNSTKASNEIYVTVNDEELIKLSLQVANNSTKLQEEFEFPNSTLILLFVSAILFILHTYTHTHILENFERKQKDVAHVLDASPDIQNMVGL